MEVIEDLFERSMIRTETLGWWNDSAATNRIQTFRTWCCSCINLFSKPFPREWLEERVQDFARDAGELKDSPGAVLTGHSANGDSGIMDIFKEALAVQQIQRTAAYE